MQYYLAKGKEKSGPFTGYQVMEKLASGEFTPEDLGWHEELDRWLPLSEIPAVTTILEEVRVRKETPAAPEVATTTAEDAAALGCSQVRPFVRYFARTLDMLIFWLLCWIVLGGYKIPPFTSNETFFDDFLAANPHANTINFAILFVWNFIESWLLSRYGTTLGKYLFKIEVRSTEGNYLSYKEALYRTLYVWVVVSGLGILFLGPALQVFQFFRLSKKGLTSWDQVQNLRVSHLPISKERIATVVFVFITVFLATNIIFTTSG